VQPKGSLLIQVNALKLCGDFHNQSFSGIRRKTDPDSLEELLSDGRYNLVIDIILRIDRWLNITQYKRDIVSVDSNDKVTLYQISLTVDINIHKSENNFTYKGIYVNTTYVPLRDNIDYESESDAQERLMDELAEEISYRLSKDLFKNSCQILFIKHLFSH
jgi:hypothetical protein